MKSVPLGDKVILLLAIESSELRMQTYLPSQTRSRAQQSDCPPGADGKVAVGSQTPPPR